MTERGALPVVAYQGEPGAYGEAATLGYFGDGCVRLLPLPTFSAVCAAVRDGGAAAALLPLENSLGGSVGEAIDALVRSRIAVVGEVLLPIHHQLLGIPGVTMEAIEHVASHWQALAQCEPFLAAHGWRLVVTYDTAGAARELASSGDGRGAVIASADAARQHGLAIVAREIQGTLGSLTRFVVATVDGASVPAGTGPLAPGANASSSSLIVFETRHVAGALQKALGAFAEVDVNLSRIESRPTRRQRWEYRFVVSVDGAADRAPLREALAELRLRAHGVRVLGSFPSAG